MIVVVVVVAAAAAAIEAPQIHGAIYISRLTRANFLQAKNRRVFFSRYFAVNNGGVGRRTVGAQRLVVDRGGDTLREGGDG